MDVIGNRDCADKWRTIPVQLSSIHISVYKQRGNQAVM